MDHYSYEVSDDALAKIISTLSSYTGHFDLEGYINWELAVDQEFQNHDLSERQNIRGASSVLIDNALFLWKYPCRHDKAPATWKALKSLMRDEFVPEYYANILLAKLQHLKQGAKTV